MKVGSLGKLYFKCQKKPFRHYATPSGPKAPIIPRISATAVQLSMNLYVRAPMGSVLH